MKLISLVILLFFTVFISKINSSNINCHNDTLHVQYNSDKLEETLNCSLVYSIVDSILYYDMILDWPLIIEGEDKIRISPINNEFIITEVGIFRKILKKSIFSIDNFKTIGHFNDFLWCPRYLASGNQPFITYSDYIFEDPRGFDFLNDELVQLEVSYFGSEYSNVSQDTLLAVKYKEKNYDGKEFINYYDKNLIIVKFTIKKGWKDYTFELSREDYLKIKAEIEEIMKKNKN